MQAEEQLAASGCEVPDPEKGRSTAVAAIDDLEALKNAAFDDDDHGLQRSHAVDTTLLIYFFGRRGHDELKFDDFHKFMENLQTEVLQMEYNEFSKGAKTITELDFARILLRRVVL